MTASTTDESATSHHKTFGLSKVAYYIILEVIGFIAGNMICRLILILHLISRQHGYQSGGFKCAVIFRALVCLWDTEVIEMMTLNIRLSDEDWDGKMSLDTKDSVRPVKLQKSLEDFRKMNFKYQVDWSYRIDYKTETSKFRKYRKEIEKTSQRLSMISEHYQMNPSSYLRSTDRGQSQIRGRDFDSEIKRDQSIK